MKVLIKLFFVPFLNIYEKIIEKFDLSVNIHLAGIIKCIDLFKLS